jgi:hypothetical protein
LLKGLPSTPCSINHNDVMKRGNELFIELNSSIKILFDFIFLSCFFYSESLVKNVPEIFANFSDWDITIFAIVKETIKTVGYYAPCSGPANQVYNDIIVVFYPEEEVVDRHTVHGLPLKSTSILKGTHH